MRVCDKRMNSLSDTCTDPARTFVTDNALFGQRSDGASTTSCCVFAAAGARAARRGKTQRRVETYFLQLVSLYKHTGFKKCKLKGKRHLEAFCRGQQAKNRRVGGVVQAQAVSPHSVVDSRTVSYTRTLYQKQLEIQALRCNGDTVAIRVVSIEDIAVLSIPLVYYS